MEKDILTLGIESSCDETSVAVVKNGREVLSNIIDTQIPIHEKYGGVVPEIASRNHIEAISRVTKLALKEANVTLDDIDAITPTYGPGLVGALLVGLSYAKALSFATNKPLVGVNHIQGHIAANYITYKEYFTIQKINILFMEYCYAILQCVQIGHGLLHCPFRNFRGGLFACSGQRDPLGHEDGTDEVEVAVGVVPDGFVGVGAVAVQGEEIGVADVILADLLDEKAAVEPEGADLTVAGRALHAEGNAAVGEIRLHGVAVDTDGKLGVRVGRGVVLYKKIAGRLRRAGSERSAQQRYDARRCVRWLLGDAVLRLRAEKTTISAERLTPGYIQRVVDRVDVALSGGG